ncbi:tripartite tricarboxylate transporter TctB family protein [Nocardioides maradonensis]
MDTTSAPQRAGYSEYGVVGLLAGLGTLVLLETPSIREPLVSHGTLSPRVMPYFVGALLLVVAALLAVDIFRGGHGEQEEGEDVDLSHGTDWKILLALAVLVAGCGQLVPLIGFPIAGAALFFGVARLLGSRRLVLDLVVAAVLSVTAYLLFTEFLGIALPLFGGA